jgi:hypothetical protein
MTAEPQLNLAVGSHRIRIQLTDQHAPKLLAQLLAHLPMKSELHAAKIAGNHIILHAPFIADLDGAATAADVVPGSLIYWPERQLLELTVAITQQESSRFALLGLVDADFAALVALGQYVIDRQGREMIWAELSSKDAQRAPRAPQVGVLAGLSAARNALWQGPPTEIVGLVARRGVNMPAGPLIYAEAYARQTQELLWRLRARARAGDEAYAARAASDALELCATRLHEFCGLPEAARTLLAASRLLERHPEFAFAIIEETILFTGRLAGWLDARLPWRLITDAVRSSHTEWS